MIASTSKPPRNIFQLSRKSSHLKRKGICLGTSKRPFSQTVRTQKTIKISNRSPHRDESVSANRLSIWPPTRLTHRYSARRFDLETKSDFNKPRELKYNINKEFKPRAVAARAIKLSFPFRSKGVHRRSWSVSAQPTNDFSPILAQTNSASARIPDSLCSRQQASRLRQTQLADSSRPQPQSVRDPIAVSSRPVCVPVCGSSLWWSIQQTSKVKGNSKPNNP